MGKQYVLAVSDHNCTEVSRAGKKGCSLEKEVQAVLDMKKGSLDVVIVDLAGVPFVLSSVIAQIVKLYKGTKKMGAAFRVVNANTRNYDMLQALKLTELFEVLK